MKDENSKIAPRERRLIRQFARDVQRNFGGVFPTHCARHKLSLVFKKDDSHNYDVGLKTDDDSVCGTIKYNEKTGSIVTCVTMLFLGGRYSFENKVTKTE